MKTRTPTTNKFKLKYDIIAKMTIIINGRDIDRVKESTTRS